MFYAVTQTRLKNTRLILAISLFLYAFPAPGASAEDSPTYETARFALYFGTDQPSEFKNINAKKKSIIEESVRTLNDTYDELSRIFHAKPEEQVVLRFLSPEQFRKKTGSPAWTSAMYFGGEITIPIAEGNTVDLNELYRAIRHEYVHAVVAELSARRCPAWLDEGVAQLIEGQPNPLLGPALRDWIKNNDAMPLGWLENGYTVLNNDFVPAAYAQSLFIARQLVNKNGFEAIRNYLQYLRLGFSEELAFEAAFAVKKRQFEQKLTTQIQRWAESDQPHP